MRVFFGLQIYRQLKEEEEEETKIEGKGLSVWERKEEINPLPLK